MNEIDTIKRYIGRQEAMETGVFIPLNSPLTSTDWDGDAYSTTAKTLIDLSVSFGAPPGIRAVDMNVWIKDSASEGINLIGVILSPNNTANSGRIFSCGGMPKTFYSYETGIVPCDANGDIYYQAISSGAGTLVVWLQIWGYWI